MKFFLLFLFGFLFSSNTALLSIDGATFTLQDFYTMIPKNHWTKSDSIKQEKLLNDFIQRHLVIIEAKSLGFMNDPGIYSKIKEQSNQLLVNETYEQLVAKPLIDKNVLDEARQNAKKELLLHHILIGHKESYLASPPKRSINEALLLSQEILLKHNEGLDFNALAIEFSDDPSAQHNQGRLGWVEWGLTASAFQSTAFQLDKNEVSIPTLTPFGYHLILVEEIRPSDYDKMTLDEFNDAIINLSKRTIRNSLRGAATKHDSVALVNNGVVFNYSAINKIVSSYKGFLSSNKNNINKHVDIADVVAGLIKKDVLFVRNKLGFGPMWLINKIKNLPLSRHPVLDSKESAVAIIKNFILQDIALIKGEKQNVLNSFSYKKRKEEIINGALYDAYLKYVINSIEGPDSLEIKQYYNKNKKNYSTKQAFLINELRFRSRHVADSIKTVLTDDEDLSLYENNVLKIVYNHNLSITKNSHPTLYDKAFNLNKNELSPVLSSFGGNFSIFKINKTIPPVPQKLSLIYSKIESLLRKEKQNENKLFKINALKNKYKININRKLLP